MHIQCQYNLIEQNTLALSSTAEYFCVAESIEDIRLALEWANNKEQPVYILGGGSNVLLKPNLPGLVLVPSIEGKKVISETEEHVDIQVGAGENWHDFVTWCLQNHYFGAENLSLIPGTVGAAPIQNIGAYGVELKDIFLELNAIERSNGVERVFNLTECRFGYRDSVFKRSLRDKFVISHVTFRLNKKSSVKLKYPALKQYFIERFKGENVDGVLVDSLLNEKSLDQISASDVAEAVCQIRSTKLPDPKKLPNVGSFFKNPVVDLSTYERIKAQFPDVVAYPHGDNEKKIAAGWMIEKSGWKGRSAHGAAVHSAQALVIVNPNRVSYIEVMRLAEEIQNDVKSMFGVVLEKEPQVIE